jgi:hypothetical protein
MERSPKVCNRQEFRPANGNNASKPTTSKDMLLNLKNKA